MISNPKIKKMADRLLGFSNDEIIEANRWYYESIKLHKFITGGKYE